MNSHPLPRAIAAYRQHKSLAMRAVIEAFIAERAPKTAPKVTPTPTQKKKPVTR